MLTSCSRAVVFHMFNNTELDIEVLTRDSVGKVTRHHILKNQSEQLQFTDHLIVNDGTNRWEYEVKSVPKFKKYMTSESFGPLRVDIQLEKDGSIFVLAPKSTIPASNFPDQPDGYPLRPKLNAVKM